MLSELPIPGSAEDWLRHARSDFELARMPKPPAVLHTSLCFHAQQAAERALKAVLISRGISFPSTHSIRALLDLLSSAVTVPQEVAEGAALTEYAVTLRYPTNAEPVNEEEWKEAVRLAEVVFNWAEKLVGKQAPPPTLG